MQFKTMSEAEDYFWAHLAKHNDDERGLEFWLSDQEIEETAEEDTVEIPVLGTVDAKTGKVTFTRKEAA